MIDIIFDLNFFNSYKNEITLINNMKQILNNKH